MNTLWHVISKLNISTFLVRFLGSYCFSQSLPLHWYSPSSLFCFPCFPPCCWFPRSCASFDRPSSHHLSCLSSFHCFRALCCQPLFPQLSPQQFVPCLVSSLLLQFPRCCCRPTSLFPHGCC